jgi:hypothetical protein
MEIKVYQYILLLAFVSAIWLRKKNNVVFLMPFLGLAVFFELVLGKLMKYYYDNNMITTNIFSIICVIFYLFLFTKEFRRKWFWAMASIYMFSLMVSSFVQGFMAIMSIAYNTGMILVMLAVFSYLYDLIMREQYKPLHQIPLFWMAIGILLFYSSSFPILNFLNRFIAADYDFALRMIDMLSIGNIFLSLGYFGTIICQKNIRTLSTSLP